MKKPIMWVAALLTASCTPALKVEVANTTPTERDDETVEIAWSEVAALKGVTPDNIVVLNDDNEQIPSQVLFRGGTEPQALIFQTDADPMETKRFKIARTTPPRRSAARFPNVTTTTPGRTTR